MKSVWKNGASPPPSRSSWTRCCPDPTTYYTGQISVVDTMEGAKDLVELAYQRPLSHVGFDTEFSYEGPPLTVHQGQEVYDPTTVKPLLLQLALAEPDDQGGGTFYRFVVDVRDRDVAAALEPLFDLPGALRGPLPEGGAPLSPQNGAYPCPGWSGTPGCTRRPWSWVSSAKKTSCPRTRMTPNRPGPGRRMKKSRSTHLSLLSTCQRHGGVTHFRPG